MSFIKNIDVNAPADSEKAGDGAKHIRLLKTDIKETLPNIDGKVNLSDSKLNEITALISFAGTTKNIIKLDNAAYHAEAGRKKIFEIGQNAKLITINSNGPLGFIVDFILDAATIDLLYPNCFLPCDGQTLPIGSKLAIMLGRTNANDPFILPDLRGQFERGHDPRAFDSGYNAADPDSNKGLNPKNSPLLSSYGDEIGEHRHDVTYEADHDTTRMRIWDREIVHGTFGVRNYNTTTKMNFDNETRPNCITVNKYIRIN